MKKWGIIASLATVSLVSAAIGATAATGLKEVKAYLNTGLTLKLAGDTWTPRESSGNRIYPITYNGRTYLPVRAVGEAMGVTIGFDSASNTVQIGEGVSTGTAGATTNTTVGHSRSAPAPIGTKVHFKGNAFLGYDGQISISKIIRGSQAWDMIREANSFNDAPIAGHEYMLVQVNMDIIKTVKAGAAASLFPFDLTLVSTSGKDYEYASVVVPAPEYQSSLYEGASHTGWVAFTVKVGDPSPLITFNRDYDGSGGIWFKTTN